MPNPTSPLVDGAHVIVHSKNPDADRAFLRDVLGLPHVDVGHGWLIFGLPPSEAAVHPTEEAEHHELYLMTPDVAALVSAMASHGVTCTPPRDMGWGVLTQVTLPGGGTLGVYQPRHARPTAMAAPEDLVRTLYAAFGRGDVAAVIAMLDPDVEWSEPENPLNPAAGTRHGHAGFLEWLRVGKASEDILSLEPRQCLSDATTVAVIGHARCRVKRTGRVYDTDFVHTITFRGGRIVRFQEFFDTFAAAEAFK